MDKPPNFRCWLISIALLLTTLPAACLDDYTDHVIGGWTVHLDRVCSETQDREQRQAFDAVLDDQIAKLRRLPPNAQDVLKPVAIFVSSGTYRAFGAQHHPSETWLKEHGYPHAFARNVEICNWREFITLVKGQPFCLLHEIAHAYHDRLPTVDGVIRAAYEHAKTAGLYQQVTRGHGKELVQAYAITNHHEYFAELSEAYFGENDFFPYSRDELRAYDPDGYAMIEVVWKLR